MNTMNTTPHQLAVANKSIIDKVISRSLYAFEPYLSEEDKQDLSSEGYLALYKAALNYSMEKGANFATFAYKCVKNHLLDYISHYISRYAMCDNYVSLDDELAGPFEEFSYSNDEMLNDIDMRMAMDTLDMRERDIFSNKTGIGIHHKGMDSKELASKLNLTPQHVNRLYNHALEKVQRFMTA